MEPTHDTPRIVIVSKANPRPCGAPGINALDVFRGPPARFFLGYPIYREEISGASDKPMSHRLINPRTRPKEWGATRSNDAMYKSRGYAYTRTRIELVQDVLDKGGEAIAVIPRPRDDTVHVGRISRPLEVFDDDRTRTLLRDTLKTPEHKDFESYLADVSLGWPVDGGYSEVPLSRLPAWLYHQIMKDRRHVHIPRSHPVDPNEEPFDVFDQLLRGEAQDPENWTLNPATVGRRLVGALNPYSLENLVVSLLQLEHPEDSWRQTGGVGDAGVDGIGVRGDGGPSGLLQVKFAAHSPPPEAEREERHYVAVLLQQGMYTDWTRTVPGRKFEPWRKWEKNPNHLGYEWIVSRFLEHRRYLPLAGALRVGRPK